MNKYTVEEMEFLDKVAIAYIQGKIASGKEVCEYHRRWAYTLAVKTLDERRKIFEDE